VHPYTSFVIQRQPRPVLVIILLFSPRQFHTFLNDDTSTTPGASGIQTADMPFAVSQLWAAPEINPINKKARSIPVLNPVDKYGRTFFFSWLGFMIAFLSW
jgi:hypothetical protein